MSSAESFPSGGEDRPELKTLSSFLLDRQHSVFLSDMIEREGSDEEKELAQRFADKRPEAGDIERLIERWQKPFKERFEQYSAAKNTFTPALLARFGKIDSTFAEALVSLGGVDKMANAYRSNLLSLAVNHPAQFKGIQESLLAYQEHEKVRARALEKAKAYGFDMAKYDSLVGIADAGERAQKIRAQVKSQMTGMGKFFNFVSFTWLSRRKGKGLREAMESEREIADAVETALVGTANDNAEVRAAFAHEAMDRIPPMERSTMSFTDLRDLKLEEFMLEAWKKDPRSEQVSALATPELKQAMREAFRDEWKQGKKTEMEAKGGLWATIAVMRLAAYDPDISLLVERKNDNHRHQQNRQGQQPRRGGRRGRGQQGGNN